MDFEKLIKDSKDKDLAVLREEISKIMLEKKYTTEIFTTFTFNGFYRARKHNNIKGDFKDGILTEFINEKEFWNPPVKFAKMGRCNEEGESLFYCSSDFITAVLEVKPVTGDFITVANFKNLNPQNKPEFRINLIGKTYLIKIRELALLFEDYILDQSQIEIEDFLDKLFHQIVDDTETYKYKLSVVLSHIFMTDGTDRKRSVIETDGLIYPSIIRNQKSYCFVLKPNLVDRFFMIEYIQTLEVIEKEDDFIKLKLVRNGQPKYMKKNAGELFDVFWMKPPNKFIDFINY